MRTAEIMLNDYVILKEKMIPVKVASITRKKIGYHMKENETYMHYCRISEIIPMQLTDDFFTNNGFELYKSGYTTTFFRQDDYDNQTERYNIEADRYENHDIYTYEDGVYYVEARFTDDDGCTTTVEKRVKFVHEFQQVLRTTGLEEIDNKISVL